TITLTGTGGVGTSNDNDHGVYIFDTANISANGPGQINIIGSANGANGIGVFFDQSITIGGANSTGSVIISANTIDVSNSIIQSTGDVSITTTSGPIHAGSYAWDAYTLSGASIGLVSKEG